MYGPPHEVNNSEASDVFDALFKSNLRNAVLDLGAQRFPRRPVTFNGAIMGDTFSIVYWSMTLE